MPNAKRYSLQYTSVVTMSNEEATTFYRVDRSILEDFFLTTNLYDQLEFVNWTGKEERTLSLCDAELVEINRRKRARLAFFERTRFEKARRDTDPFDCIVQQHVPKNAFNRSAVKLWEMDELLFDGKMTRPDEPLVYVDLCGGPGGFMQYVFGRRVRSKTTQRCIGIGVTRGCTLPYAEARVWEQALAHGLQLNTRKERQFRWMDERCALCFIMDRNGSKMGDVLHQPTRDTLRKRVTYAKRNMLPGTKVQLVLADGGIDVTGREEEQELLSQRLLLAQTILALDTLGRGGDFIVKLFDVTTLATTSLVLSLALCFEEFTIFKPCTSRAINSERYLVLRKHLADDRLTMRIHKRLIYAYTKWPEAWGDNVCVELLPANMLQKQTDFCQLMTDMWKEQAIAQSKALSKLFQYYTSASSLVLPPKECIKQEKRVSRLSTVLSI